MYCMPLDLLTDIPKLHLVALVNDENRPPYNDETAPDGWIFDDTQPELQREDWDPVYMRVYDACYDAAAAIEPYLLERFKLPVNGSCPKLNKIARTLALSFLFSRRGIIFAVDFAKSVDQARIDLEYIRDAKLYVPELESLTTPIHCISNKVSSDQFLSNDFLNNY